MRESELGEMKVKEMTGKEMKGHILKEMKGNEGK